MVSRSTLINFCAALLCTGSAAAAESSRNRSSYLRQPRVVASSSSSESHNNDPSSSGSNTPRSDESSLEASKLQLAEFASSIAAYSAAYNQAILDDEAESQQPAANNIIIDSIKNKSIEGVTLINEDFCSTATNDLFTTHDNNNCSTTTTIHGRNGVFQLSPNSNHNHHSTITTPNLLLPPSSSFSSLTITFSYQTIEMTTRDKFCLDLSTDNGLSWHDEECYEYGIDFENGFWYDDVGVMFDLGDLMMEEDDNSSSLSVRWFVVGDDDGGDVLLDWVKVVASP